jgi:hypothetical protein
MSRVVWTTVHGVVSILVLGTSSHMIAYCNAMFHVMAVVLLPLRHCLRSTVTVASGCHVAQERVTPTCPIWKGGLLPIHEAIYASTTATYIHHI